MKTIDKDKIHKILVVRTDRIGDLLLSTPAIRALREVFPSSHIAIMVSPYTKELAKQNPDLDEVIIYDKERGLKNTLRFIWLLRKKRFDITFILSPKTRNNVIIFLAGILMRVSYDIKWGYLANIRIAHRRHLPEKHEIEYNLDFVRALGIDISKASEKLVLNVEKKDEDYISSFFKKKGIKQDAAVVIVHPGSTALPKKWPVDRFAEVSDELSKRKCKIIVIGANNEANTSFGMMSLMKNDAIDITGKFNLKQLSALLKRSNLLISNDSGPMHIATAVGTPMVIIFGRTEGSLGPKRWGPTQGNCIILQKDIGCRVCKADKCERDFECLKAVRVDEVVQASERLLKKK